MVLNIYQKLRSFVSNLLARFALLHAVTITRYIYFGIVIVVAC